MGGAAALVTVPLSNRLHGRCGRLSYALRLTPDVGTHRLNVGFTSVRMLDSNQSTSRI